MAKRPVLDGLNLVVSDMDATLAFYRKLGVDIPGDAVWKTDSGGHHATAQTEGDVDLDFDSIALAAVYNGGFNEATSPRTLIGFRVETRDAVDELYAELTGAGYKGMQEPWDAFWGARAAVVEDPDGRHVGFMSPVDPERRSAPPAI